MSAESPPPGDKSGQQIWADSISHIVKMQLETQQKIAKEMADHREQMLKAYKSASSISGFRDYGELAIIMHACGNNKDIRRKCLELCQQTKPQPPGDAQGAGSSGGPANGST